MTQGGPVMGSAASPRDWTDRGIRGWSRPPNAPLSGRKGGSFYRCKVSESEGKLRLPESAIKRLQALPDICKEGKRVNGLFRLLEGPEWWRQASANINANKGAMTPGVGSVTMDGLSPERAAHLRALLKEGRYRPNPARRTYVPKPTGKMRPLGMPSGDDQLVQGMVRKLLEQIYEPVFSNWSHGLRPNRSCHTALKQVERWDGTKWLVEMDIEGFLDTIDHDVMVQLLEKNIDDKRFIDLTQAFRKAGYREDWRFHGTSSGTPQGGIVTPPTKFQKRSSSSRRASRVHSVDPAMGPGFWAHLSRWWSLTTAQASGSEEAVMARRDAKTAQALEVSVMFEPSPVAPACVAQAYERVVPIRRRATSAPRHHRRAGRERLQPRAGGAHA
jgi:hypothetical protein